MWGNKLTMPIWRILIKDNIVEWTKYVLITAIKPWFNFHSNLIQTVILNREDCDGSLWQFNVSLTRFCRRQDVFLFGKNLNSLNENRVPWMISLIVLFNSSAHFQTPSKFSSFLQSIRVYLVAAVAVLSWHTTRPSHSFPPIGEWLPHAASPFSFASVCTKNWQRPAARSQSNERWKEETSLISRRDVYFLFFFFGDVTVE